MHRWAFKAPNRVLGSSFCCWIARQRLAQKECFSPTPRGQTPGGVLSPFSVRIALIMCLVNCWMLSAEGGASSPTVACLWWCARQSELTMACQGQAVYIYIYIYIYIYTHIYIYICIYIYIYMYMYMCINIFREREIHMIDMCIYICIYIYIYIYYQYYYYHDHYHYYVYYHDHCYYCYSLYIYIYDMALTPHNCTPCGGEV